MITIAVERRQSAVEETEIITTGSVGIEVKFNFNGDWDGLSRVAVFRVGDKEDWYDIMLDETNTCAIPWELLTVENEGEPVFVGAEGTLTDGTVVIPTVWVSVGAIKPGAHSGNASGADPTPTQWSQIRNLAETAAVSASNAEDYAEDAHETAEAAQEIVNEFEGFTATATTLSAGSDATASYSDGVLSLGIPQGQKGEDGTSGEDGDDGVTFTPSVSSAGVISWTNDGGKQNPDPVDIMGPMGPPGVAVDDDPPTDGELVWVETDNSQSIVLPEVDDTTPSNNNTYSSNKIESIKGNIENTLNAVENGLAIIVNGDVCSTAVPIGGYAYIKNNTHGLAEGLYTNVSSSAFPVSGGTADGTVFTAVSDGGLNHLIGFSSGQLTPSTSFGSYIQHNSIKQRFGFIELNYGFLSNENLPNSQTGLLIATIPQQYRPALRTAVTSYMQDAGGNYISSSCDIDPDSGSVSVKFNSSVARWVFVHCVYSV